MVGLKQSRWVSTGHLSKTLGDGGCRVVYSGLQGQKLLGMSPFPAQIDCSNRDPGGFRCGSGECCPDLCAMGSYRQICFCRLLFTTTEACHY